MPENLKKSFKSGNVAGLLEGLYQGVEGLEQADSGLEHGPLEKSKETYKLEALFRHIVLGHNVRIKTTGTPLEYSATVIHEGQTIHFNISDLLKRANLNHITLSPEDMTQYVDYTRETSSSKPQKASSKLQKARSKLQKAGSKLQKAGSKLQKASSKLQKASSKPQKAKGSKVKGSGRGFPDEQYFKDRDTKHALDHLSYAEKIGINIYTSKFFVHMNALLRGAVSPITNEEQERNVKEALVHSIMSVSGLNKISDTPVPGTLRAEKSFSDEVLQKRILIAEEGGAAITLESGFISSSAGGTPYKGDTKILFTGLIGKHIKALSVVPEENEFLIPPTQLLWKRHQEIDGVHYFHATPVRTLTKAATPDPQEIKLIALTVRVERTLELVTNIEQLYKKEGWRIHKDPKRNEQIARLVSEANELISNTDLSPLEKLVKIRKVLYSVRYEINQEDKHKNKASLLFSKHSRLKRVIDKIEKLDPEILEKNTKIKPKII